MSEIEQAARIAVLELALENIRRTYDNADDSEESQEKMFEQMETARKILSSSKLGELFQALLREHSMLDANKNKAWSEAEALRKECNL